MTIEKSLLVAAVAFAVQQIVQILDWPATATAGFLSRTLKVLTPEEFKKSVTAAFGLAIGLILAAYVDAVRLFEDPRWLAVLVTALFIGAGTDGMNSILKYLAYVKDSRKVEARNAALRFESLAVSLSEVVIAHTADGPTSVTVDGSPVQVSAGEGRCPVLPGRHVLHCLVENPGTTWSLAVTAPAYVHCSQSKTTSTAPFEQWSCAFTTV